MSASQWHEVRPRAAGGADASSAQPELPRVHRALRMLNDCNLAIVRERSETTLLERICRVVVDVGGYRKAWIGFARPGDPASLQPMAHAGFAARELEALRASAKDSDRVDPAAEAVRTQQPYGVRRGPTGAEPVAGEGAVGPADCASILAVPLVGEAGVLGALTVYSSEQDGFEADETRILAELGGNLAFGLDALRVRAERDHATAAWRDHESRLAEAERVAHVGYWVREPDGRRVVWSDETYRIFGQPPQALSADLVRSFIHPADRDRAVQQLEEAVRGDHRYDVAYRIVRPNGEIRHVHCKADVQRDAAGRPQRIFGTVQDITERQRADDERLAHVWFLESLDRVNRAIHGSGDLDRMMRDVLEALVSIFECDRAWLMFPCDPDAPAWRVRMQAARAGLAAEAGECDVPVDAELASAARLLRQATGPVRFATEGAPPVPAALRELLGVHSFIAAALHPKAGEPWLLALDECRRAQPWSAQDDRLLQEIARRLADALGSLLALQSLQESEEKLEQAQRVARIGYWDRDFLLNRATLSEETCRLFGLPLEERVQALTRWQQRWEQLIHPEDRARTMRAAEQAMAGGPRFDVEYRILTANGDVHVVHSQGDVICDRAGRPRRLFGTVQDITERKRTEAALRQSQEHLATLIQSVDGIVWEADTERSRFTFVSPQAERLLGHRAAAWLEEPEFWNKRVHADDRERVVSACRSAVRENRDHEVQYRMLAADGREVWLHDLVSVIAGPDGQVHLRGIMVDITRSKEAEAALRESELRFRQVTETIGEVFWLTDVAKHSMIYISPAYEKIWGRTCAELYAHPQSWLEAVHPDDRERVRDAALRSQAAGTYDLEYRIIRPDRAVRWIHDRAFPIKDADGEIRRVAGVAEDVTRRRQLEEQFHQAQKMEAIGRLAGGIAHDFNNLLTVVQMQTSLMLAEKKMDAATEHGVRQIMDASVRAANLTRQLLTFSRQQVKQARLVDISEIVTGTTKLLRRVLGEDIALESRFAPVQPLVRADPSMIEQVLMNLVINARDAMPDGGRLTLSLDVVTLDGAETSTNPGAKAGRFVRLSVADTGHGIAPENLPRIFEPFFTTKEVGKGTGLGLATVFGIVQQHHGWIEVDSELGWGTTFRVHLPAVDGSVDAADATPARATSGGVETIMLVEDEPAVRGATASALRRAGYRVVEAGSAPEALRAWDEASGRVDLLVTDLIMPGGMSGGKLAAELATRRKGLKIVYTSGYSGETLGRELTLEPGRNFLPKPYPVTELLAVVRQRLDEP